MFSKVNQDLSIKVSVVFTYKKVLFYLKKNYIYLIFIIIYTYAVEFSFLFIMSFYFFIFDIR